MISAIKKIDRKLLIIACSIIFLPLIVVIVLATIRSCGNRKITYKSYEKRMLSAAQRYIKAENKIPKNESELFTVKLDTLVDKGYIKSSEKLLDDVSCTGEVSVRRNGSSVESNAGGFLNYTYSLDCDKYNTIHLKDKIIKNLVTSESGLYLINNEYIFKGNKVNNYIKLNNVDYRIMSIDSDGFIKLIRAEGENGVKLWDNKFNTEVNHYYGKNIYKDSQILNYILSDYQNNKKISKQNKKHIVARDVCIGKRNSNDYSISRELDCSEKLEKQIVSLMNISDFALASSDEECNSLKSNSCRNYNYLSDFASSSWSMNVVSDNSYEVFLISDGLLDYQNADLYNEYNIIFYIDGNELYNKGEGTELNPYIIKDQD